jgi:hypothetical protein
VKILISVVALAGSLTLLVQDLMVRAFDYL